MFPPSPNNNPESKQKAPKWGFLFGRQYLGWSQIILRRSSFVHLGIFWEWSRIIHRCSRQVTSRASRLVATRLGLGTASLSQKLLRQRSGVRFLTECAQAHSSGSTAFAARMSVLPAGIEPTSHPPQGCILSVERRERLLYPRNVTLFLSFSTLLALSDRERGMMRAWPKPVSLLVSA